jgi:hypothetical protein
MAFWVWVLLMISWGVEVQAQVPAATAPAGPVAVIATSGPDGHFTIALDESGTATSPIRLSFSTLMTWAFDPASASAAPAPVAVFDRQPVELTGFMFPLEEGDRIKAFMLMASTQTCCYGPRPQYNQFALVEIAAPVEFERFRPVTVAGVFVIEPKPEDGYIFRLEAQSLRLAPQMPTPALEAPTRPAIAFSWDILRALAPKLSSNGVSILEEAHLPDAIATFAGAYASLTGNIVYTPGENGSISAYLAFHPWDGCCTGIPPDAFSGVQLEFNDAHPAPEPWLKSGTFHGTLEALPVEQRRQQGFFRLISPTPLQLSDKSLNTDYLPPTKPALLQAVLQADLPLVKLLLRGGTSVGTRDAAGNTALHEAALWGLASCAELLLETGLPAAAFNQKHETPLHLAARHGHLAMLAVLATGGVDLNLQDKSGFTPLHWAIAQGNLPGTLLLLERGANPRLTTQFDVFPN